MNLKELSYKFTRDYIRAGNPNPVKAGITTARKFIREIKKEEAAEARIKQPEPWVGESM
jgi:hypothetical protein